MFVHRGGEPRGGEPRGHAAGCRPKGSVVQEGVEEAAAGGRRAEHVRSRGLSGPLGASRELASLATAKLVAVSGPSRETRQPATSPSPSARDSWNLMRGFQDCVGRRE